MSISDTQFLRATTHGIGTDPALCPLDPGYVYASSQTEGTPVYWHKQDVYSATPGGPLVPGSGVQRMDCYVGTRAGLSFIINTFNFNYANDDTFGVFNPDNDGGDALSIGSLYITSTSNVGSPTGTVRGLGIFYTQDGSAADDQGRFWESAQNPTLPGWVLALIDAGATLIGVNCDIDTSTGVTVITSTGDVLAPTLYQILPLPIPFVLDGKSVTKTINCLIIDHFDSIPSAGAERLVYDMDGDLGRLRWEGYGPAGSAVTTTRVALSPTIAGMPAIASGSFALGLVMTDCRHYGEITRDAAGTVPAGFAWPPANFVPLAGVGIGNAVITPIPVSPPAPPPASLDSPQIEIGLLYQQVLGRVADSGGLATYVGALANGTTLTAIRLTMAQSEEAQDDLGALYEQVLNRAADASGLATYTALLGETMSLAVIAQEIALSTEAQNDLTNLFQSITGRAPSAGEQAWMTAQLACGVSQAVLRTKITG